MIWLIVVEGVCVVVFLVALVLCERATKRHRAEAEDGDR